MLARFPAYTYSTLMAEDAELLRILNTQARAAQCDDHEGW